MRLTLCGSARFEEEFHKWNEDLTLAGDVVYSLAVFPSQKQGQQELVGRPAHEWYSAAQKAQLDGVHRAKIDNSDGIVVLDVGGYVGNSTQGEIDYARAQGKAVYWLELVDQSLPTEQRAAELLRAAIREGRAVD